MTDQQQQSAVATRPEERPPDETGMQVEVTSIAGRDDIERITATVQLPPAFQYVIPGKKKVGNDWVQNDKVGITSDGYDYLNRWVGVAFYLPDKVPDSDGRMSSNPIHRPDYIYMRMGAVWYNETGALVGATEDLEVDYQFVYQNARLEAFDSEVLLDDRTKQPLFGPDGHPMLVLKNANDEKKALKALNQLRTMGMRYAQTVLRTRLLKVAIGIKALPLQSPRPFNLRVVGYRDKLTLLERQKKAEDALGLLYGSRPPSVAPISHAEVIDIEAEMTDEVVAATVAEATGMVAEMTDDEKLEALQAEWEASQQA